MLIMINYFERFVRNLLAAMNHNYCTSVKAWRLQ